MVVCSAYASAANHGYTTELTRWHNIRGQVNDQRVLCVDVSNNTYHISTLSDPSTPITNTIGNVPYQVVFGQGRALALTGVTIQSVSLDGDEQLVFGIYGQTDQATTATITLACQG